MQLLLEITVVFFVGMLPFILTAFPNHYAAANRALSNPELLLGSWTRAMAVVLVILYIAAHQPAGVASLGLYSHNPGRNVSDSLLGIIIFAICLVLFTVTVRLLRKKSAAQVVAIENDSPPQIHDATRYKRLPERLAYLSLLVTGNLLAVIASHLYYDIAWTVGRWRASDRQDPGAAPAPVTTFGKYFYPVFIVINACILGVFAYQAGFFTLSW